MLQKVQCSECNKYLFKSQSELNRTKHSFCSKECLNIFRSRSYLGEGNPFIKHVPDLSCIFNLNHNGAYILGLIWSDGHLTTKNVQIVQHKEYSGELLEKISHIIFGKNICTYQEIPTGLKAKLTIGSKTFVEYLLSLGGINVGKKSSTIEFPDIPEEFHWSFLCGVFDGDGGFRYDYNYPAIKIRSNSVLFLRKLALLWEVNYSDGLNIRSYGNKALDICGKMYENVTLCHEKKYNYFVSILNYEPRQSSNKHITIDSFKVCKLRKDATLPYKARVTDSGYDLSVVEFEDMGNGLYMGNTKLALEPPLGYYFDMVGRSSLPKNNMHFVGGVGVLDKSYVGPVKIVLQKIDVTKPLPDLPFRCAQIIPRKIEHFNVVEVDELSESSRGDGGFGSTDSIKYSTHIPSDVVCNKNAMKAIAEFTSNTINAKAV